MIDKDNIYYNEFFEKYDKDHTFSQMPHLKNLTQVDIFGDDVGWSDMARFYFLPFLVNCYRFTR